MNKLVYVYFSNDFKFYKYMPKILIKKIFYIFPFFYRQDKYFKEFDLLIKMIKIPFLYKDFLNIKLKKREKLLNKIFKFINKNDIKHLISEQNLKEFEIFCNEKNIKFYNGKFAIKYEISAILKLITKLSNKDLSKYKIGIIANDVNDLSKINILDDNSIRFLNVFLNYNEGLKEHIEIIYDEYGLLIENMPTMKVLFGSCNIIINLIDTKIKTKNYNIVINIGNSILSGKSNGVIINDIYMSTNLENKEFKNILCTSKFYEFLLKNEFNIEEFEYKVQHLIGLNGKISSKDF